MLKPETQIATLRATNFFPVVDDAARRHAAGGAASPARRSRRLTRRPDALPALLPVGLGDLGGQFNQVYIDTFERIVLAGQDIAEVLDEQGDALARHHRRGRRAVLGADAPSDGPCPVN